MHARVLLMQCAVLCCAALMMLCCRDVLMCRCCADNMQVFALDVLTGEQVWMTRMPRWGSSIGFWKPAGTLRLLPSASCVSIPAPSALAREARHGMECSCKCATPSPCSCCFLSAGMCRLRCGVPSSTLCSMHACVPYAAVQVRRMAMWWAPTLMEVSMATMPLMEAYCIGKCIIPASICCSLVRSAHAAKSDPPSPPAVIAKRSVHSNHRDPPHLLLASHAIS